MTRSFVLSLMLVFLVTGVAGQTKFYNLPAKKQIDRAKISLNNFSKFETKSLTILNDSVIFTDIASQKAYRLSLDDVSYLRIKTGTRAGEWAIYGGLFMGLVCLTAVADVGSDPNRELKDNAAGIIAGFVAGGAAVGAIIGATMPRWKTYYVNTPIIKNLPVDVGVFAFGKQAGVSLRFSLTH